MAIKDAIILLNAAVSKLRTLNGTAAECKKQVGAIRKQIQEIHKATDGELSPEQRAMCNELEKSIKEVLSRFPVSKSVGSERWKSDANDNLLDINEVLRAAGAFFHSAKTQTSDAARIAVAEAAKTAHEVTSEFENRLTKAEEGDIRALDWFFRVFGSNENIRIDDLFVTDESGKRRISSAADLLLFKEQNTKAFHALFAKAKGVHKSRSSYHKPPASITGDVQLPEITGDVSVDRRNLFSPGKSVQPHSALEYARTDSARTENTEFIENAKNTENGKRYVDWKMAAANDDAGVIDEDDPAPSIARPAVRPAIVRSVTPSNPPVPIKVKQPEFQFNSRFTVKCRKSAKAV